MAQAVEDLKRIFEAANKTGALGRLDVPVEASIKKSLTAAHGALHKEFSDVEVKLDKVVEEADRIGFRYTCAGTHRRINKRATWTGSGIARVAKGAITGLQVNEDHWGRELDLGNVPESAEDNITGNWKGQIYGIDFTLDMTQTPPDTAVKGDLTILGSSYALKGTNTPPNVSLSGSSGGKTLTFKGTWSGANEIDGTINGAGIDNQKVTLTRD